MAGTTASTHLSHWGAFTADVDAGGEVTAVRPAALDPAPSPLLGNVVGALRHPLRVAAPMVRRGWLENGPGPDERRGTDTFVELGWDEVLDRLAAELARVYSGPGPAAVFGGSYGWSSAGRFHHAQSQVHRFLNALGGYVRSVNTYSTGTASVFLPYVLGRRLDVPHSLTSWSQVAAHTELLVCFGGIPAKNLAVAPGGVTAHRSAGHLADLVRRGGEVVLAGPDRADLPDGLPARWLPLRPGTDTALMLALCRVLVAEGRHDATFLARYCAGVDEALGYLDGSVDGVEKTPGWAEAICDVPAADITALARELADRHAMVTVSWSLQRAEHGEQPVWAGVLLAALLGRIGLPGAGFGFGYGSMADSGVPLNGVGPPTLPQLVGAVPAAIPVARIADMLLQPGAEYDYDGARHRYPHIELVYWAGGNPFHHHQDLARLRRAFRAVPTVVVHEPYWTATARHADVVLPSTVTLERDDIGAVRTDPHLTAMHRHAPPYAQARDDYTTFAELSRRLGVADTFTEGRDADAWLRHLYERWRDRYGADRAPDFDTFWAQGRLELEVPPDTVLLADFRADPDAHPLRTPSGRIELHSRTVAGFGLPDCPGHPVWQEPQEWHGADRAGRYPLVLLANNPATRLHSQLDFGPHSQASKVAGREPLRMHPADAAARGIADGDLVRVHNDRGACLAGARLDGALLAGVVQMSTGAWFSPVEDPGGSPVLCTAGNVNVLTRDVGSSSLSQGCAGARVLVEVHRFDGPPPPPPPVPAGG